MPFKDELASINSSETPISPEAKEDLYKSKKDEARNYCADPSEPSAQKFDENTGQKLVEEPERSKARQMVQRAITNMEGVLGLNTSSKFGSERGSKLPIPNKETPTTYYDELLQRYDGLKIEMLAHVDTLVERGVTILSADPETGTDFVKGSMAQLKWSDAYANLHNTGHRVFGGRPDALLLGRLAKAEIKRDLDSANKINKAQLESDLANINTRPPTNTAKPTETIETLQPQKTQESPQTIEPKNQKSELAQTTVTMADIFFSNSGGWRALPEDTKAELLRTPAEQMTEALMKITKERFLAIDSPEKRALAALTQKHEADMAELNKEHARQREEELEKLYNIYAPIRGTSWEDLPEEEKKKMRAMPIREAGEYSQKSAEVV